MEKIGLGVVNQTIAEHVNQANFVIKKFVWLPKGYSDPKSNNLICKKSHFRASKMIFFFIFPVGF